MSEPMTTGLEGALRASLESNGSGGRNGAGAPNDLMGLAIKVLPKLLENAEEREDLFELQKGGFSALRKQMLLMRRELRELLDAHSGILKELHRMRELQSAMVTHLARVQLLELQDDEESYDELSDELDDAERALLERARRKSRVR